MVEHHFLISLLVSCLLLSFPCSIELACKAVTIKTRAVSLNLQLREVKFITGRNLGGWGYVHP